MNTKLFCRLITGFAAISVLAHPSYADETDPSDSPSVGEEKVIDKLTDDFSNLAGDDTETLVTALRDGDSLSYVIEVEQTVLDEDGNPVLVEQTVLDENGNPVLVEVTNPDGTVSLVEQTEQVELTELVEQTIVVENTAGPMGFGNVNLALGLAQATLPEDASYQDLVTALLGADGASGILDMRAADMGWGEIYQSFDMKVGDVMRNEKAVQQNKVTKAERVQKVARVGKPEKPEKIEKVEKPERPEKPEKPERPEKPEKPEKTSRN